MTTVAEAARALNGTLVLLVIAMGVELKPDAPRLCLLGT